MYCFSFSVRTQISRPPVDQTIIKGATATFPCGVSHDPDIQVTWQWIHKSPFTNLEKVLLADERLVIEADGTLKINGVFNEDIGNYTCNVFSSGGNDTRTVALKVIGKILMSMCKQVYYNRLVRAILL